MCLIVLAWQAHPRYRLVLAGNRDEFHARPSAALDWWPHAPDVAGGRDLQAGGTWLALDRRGRLGAVTNYRDPGSVQPGGSSRGSLVPGFLESTLDPHAYAQVAAGRGADWSGFSLLVADGHELAYAANRPGAHAERLAPGIYGLSNQRLDAPWPKLLAVRAAFAARLAGDDPHPDELFAVLADRRCAPDELLPDTGVGLELERFLSPPFIVGPTYGTRSSSLVTITHDGEVTFEERRHDAAGNEAGRTVLRLSLSLPSAPAR